MSTVTEISAAITHDVSAIPKIGSNDLVYIIPETSFHTGLTTTRSAGSITAISGTNVAEKWEGANASVNFRVESTTQSNHMGFRHFVELRVFDKNAANLQQLKALLQSGGVRIVCESNGDVNCGGAFWFLGWCSGLDVESMTWDQSSTDEPGIFVTLSTPESRSIESDPPDNVLVTNYAGTVTALEALV